MPASRLNQLWQAIDVLEAQEHIALIRALGYRDLKASSKREKDKVLYKTAYPSDIYKRNAKDVNFLLQKLGGKTSGR